MDRRVPWGVLAFLAFTLFPIAEIALLVEIGRRIGTWWTVALVIGTGLLGGALLALEGSGVIRSMKQEISKGRIPQDQIIDGVLVAVGALMLITPGIITDTMGILLMVPPTRYLARVGVRRLISKYIILNF